MASKVVEVDSISRKLVKLAGILLSIHLDSSPYLLWQNASFEMLDRFLNMPQLEGIALFQNSQ